MEDSRLSVFNNERSNKEGRRAMKTGLKVVRQIRTTPTEFSSAEYVLLFGMLIVTCAATSHFLKELLP